MINDPFNFASPLLDKELIDMFNEKRELIERYHSLGNVILIAPSGSGKNSLISHCIKELSSDKSYVYIGLNALYSNSEDEFLYKYSNTVLTKLKGATKGTIDSYLKIISSHTLSYSIGLNDVGTYDISLQANKNSLNTDQKEEILNLPDQIAEKKKIKVIVYINEFQNIKSWNKNSYELEGFFNKIWLKHKHVGYCLYGSHVHHMNSIFKVKSSPLYDFGNVITLRHIPVEKFRSYIAGKCANAGKKISNEITNKLLIESECNAFYTQYFISEILKSPKREITQQCLDSFISYLLNTYDANYKSQISSFTINQRKFLISLTAYKNTTIYSLEFIRNSGLEYSAKVDKVKNSLLKNGVIYNSNRNTLEFSDPMFRLWLKKNFFSKKY